MTHPAITTDFPRNHIGRIDWLKVLAAAKTGDTFRLQMSMRSAFSSGARYSGIRVDTFTGTIQTPRDLRRDAILAEFDSLPTGVLESLHQAATKTGLFLKKSA